VRAVVRRAADARIPIRIGVNGGSLEKDILAVYGGPTPEALAESALRGADRVASMGFEDIVISVKSSDVRICAEALRIVSARTRFPLHLGVTEAGAEGRALVKSAIGMGPLLADGIGDTMRVSLTGDPVREVYAARDILAAVGMLPGAIDVISCPTCGRCKVDLSRVAAEVRAAVSAIETDSVVSARRELFAEFSEGGMGENCVDEASARDGGSENRAETKGDGSCVLRNKGKKNCHCARKTHEPSPFVPFVVAVMGCAVNGPGEASRADVGVACGDGSAVLFERGAKIGTVSEAEIVQALASRIRDRHSAIFLQDHTASPAKRQ
jgi:4-hydroxy-3-methylbut-2-en-1-yl diphosphate synthase IspG/GcpE